MEGDGMTALVPEQQPGGCGAEEQRNGEPGQASDASW